MKNLAKSTTQLLRIALHSLWGVSTALFLVLGGVQSGVLWAQGATGSFNGTITDAAGAMIAGVKVTLINTSTNVERIVSTNGTGLFLLNSVPPGEYRLTAAKEGFATLERTGLVLGVNQTITVNLQMPVATEHTEITVEASSEQLEGTTSELGTVIDHHVVLDLPLNGREFTQLLMLAPGASRLNTSQNTSGREPTGPGPVFLPAMHGQDNRNNYFMLDGVNDNEDLFSTFAVSPTADDIQEFKVQSHNDEARFGGVLGGIVNVVTKSGTNHLHGAVWEFNRNQALGASNPMTQVKLPLNQNQFGGSIGGPVQIPHLYHGKDKTFFYYSFEGFRKTSSAATSVKTTITQDELNGDFSATSTPIYNPFVMPRTAYAGNKINPTTFNSTLVAFATNLLPVLPLGSPVVNNYVDNTPTSTRQNNMSGRLDETINPHNSAWFRYSTIDQPSVASGGFVGLLNKSDITATNIGVGYLHLFNDTTTLNLLFGHNVVYSYSYVRFTAGQSSDLLGKVPFKQAFACGYAAYGADEDCLVPTVSITGYVGGGESDSTSSPATGLYQYSGDFSKLLGRHFIQAGAAFYTSSFAQKAVGATVAFTSTGTANSSSAGGNALASFLLGVVDNSKDRVTVVPINGQREVGGYVQDQWKLLSTLTIDFGFRYDAAYWPRYGSSANMTDAIGEIDFSNGTYILQRAVGDCATLGKAPCIPGGLSNQTNVVVSPDGHLWRNVYDNYQPRVGFAYQAMKSMEIRGGFGVYFDEWSGIRQTVQGIGGDWPSVTQPSASGQSPVSAIPTVDPTNPLNGVSSQPAANPFSQSTYYRDPNAKNPKSYQYNFGIQQLLNSSTTFEADYVGSKNTRLPVGGGLYNVAATAAAGTAAQVQARRPYPSITPTRYDRSVGYGNYNALEAKLKQSLSHHLQYLVSYTWSKTMNLACDGLFGVEGCSEPNPYA